MRFKVVQDAEPRTTVLVFEPNDEVVATLKRFSEELALSASHFSGIGAFSQSVVGFFDRGHKDYRRIPFDEQMEVLSLTGDVTMRGDDRDVHAHVVLGRSDGSAHGGHLLSARVWPTLELVVVESPRPLARRFDDETRL
jgi:predicted DNA-binding protein with PD1-like motif